MHYVTVFDASLHPYRNLTLVLPGVALASIGAVMAFRPRWLEAVFRQPLAHRYIFRWSFFLLSTFYVLAATAALWRDARDTQLAAQQGNCQLLEGRVENFHPMPAEDHDLEHFEVRGVEFSYSDFVVTAGFNNTASHGGPIREGLPVRICHRDGEILRLEIAR